MTGETTEAADSTIYEVWRQDDNGNRYLMASHRDRAAAEAAVAEIEAGVPHKQLYYVVVRPVPPDEDGA